MPLPVGTGYCAPVVRACTFAFFATALAGCSAMLPSSREVTATGSGWQKYADAEKTFASIVPGKTTAAELKALNLDPAKNPSVGRLQTWQVRDRFIPNTLVTLDDLDQGVRECIQAREGCKAYEVNFVSTRTTRTGNAALDMLKLHRTTQTAGFRFNGLILVKDDVVVYTLTSGQPGIQQVVENQDYLGSVQVLASKLKLDDMKDQVASLKNAFSGNKNDQPAAPDSPAMGIAALKKP
jgi:hypothetical protein